MVGNVISISRLVDSTRATFKKLSQRCRQGLALMPQSTKGQFLCTSVWTLTRRRYVGGRASERIVYLSQKDCMPIQGHHVVGCLIPLQNTCHFCTLLLNAVSAVKGAHIASLTTECTHHLVSRLHGELKLRCVVPLGMLWDYHPRCRRKLPQGLNPPTTINGSRVRHQLLLGPTAPK